MHQKNSVPDDLLPGFSRSQLKIILDTAPVKQVIAAAGSGKTRTVIGLVTNRLLSGTDSENSILMLSFSRKASFELKERFPEAFREKLEISTFHSFALRWISKTHPEYSLKKIGIIKEKEKLSFFEKYLRKHSEIVGGIPFHLLMTDDGLFSDLFPDLYQKIHGDYADHKKKNDLLEYGDLVRIIVRDLINHESYTDQFRNRYSLIVVDEFQDTDPEQLIFLEQMKCRELVVVGDDWQAIYAFRGASVEPFLHFKKKFQNAKLFYLSENYRSLPDIVSLGNHVIQFSEKQLKKRVRAMRRKKNRNTVMALSMHAGLEKTLHDVIPDKISYRILTRSNRRRNDWINSGFQEDFVMTIHKSKGLEFDCVLLDITGGWSGYNPAVNAGGSNTNDEEIRIAYVGLTRAKNKLIILYDPEALPDRGQGALFENVFSSRVKRVSHDKIKQYLMKDIIE